MKLRQPSARYLLIRGQARGAALLAFLVAVFAIYASSPVIQSGDSRLVLYESKSLMTQGDIDLREFGRIIHGWPCYRERGRDISRYPYGTAIVAAPFLAVASLAGSVVGADPAGDFAERTPLRLEQILASAIAALAALALVLLARELIGRLAPALVLGGAMALGTSLWSTASRGLWQHGPMVLLTALALTCLARGRRLSDWRWSALAGLPFGLAFLVRPTIAVAIAIAALMLLRSDRRALPWFVASALVVIVPSIFVNLALYGTAIVPVYLPGHGPVQGGLSPTLLEGLAGTMISPARGLLVLSPFLVLAPLGLWLKRRRVDGLDVLAVLAIAAVWLGSANTSTWEAGASFGSRYLTDTLPFWTVLLAPVFALVVRPRRRWTPAVAALAALLAIGVGSSAFIHGRGAISWSTQLWNTQPTAAFAGDRDRIWDWGDLQFLATIDATQADLYPDNGLPAVVESQFCLYE